MSRSRVMPTFAALAGAALLLVPKLTAASTRSSSHVSTSHSTSHASKTSRSSTSSHGSGSHGTGTSGWHSGSHWSGGWHGFHGGWGFWPRFGWGWGWGFGPWWGWGYPYYDGYPYGYGGRYYAGYGDARTRFAAVKTDVEPDEAALYLDGKLIGTADDFDGYPDKLYLGPGHYRLEFRLDGYETLTSEVDASPGRFFRIDHHLKKIPGAKHYGTYSPARPEGGIVRYFEKRRPRRSREESDWRAPRQEGRSSGAMTEDEPAAPEDMTDDDDDTDQEGAPAWTSPERPDRRAEWDNHVVGAPPAEPEAPASPAESDARIRFDVSPPDAAVYVDDRFAGSARELDGLSAGLAVSPGQHRITVTCPGYREATLRVDAAGNREAKARIELKR